MSGLSVWPKCVCVWSKCVYVCTQVWPKCVVSVCVA